MNNSFQEASYIEAAGMDAILPFLMMKAYSGQFVTTNKGRLSKFLQATVGDLLVNMEDEIYSIELKVEQENTHNNFFIETWSNKKFSHKNIGWIFKLDCDFLWYYFMQSDELYSIYFPELWKWCFEKNRLYDFPEKAQRKYEQLNKTCGRCVPIRAILTEVPGTKIYHPLQECPSGKEVCQNV